MIDEKVRKSFVYRWRAKLREIHLNFFTIWQTRIIESAVELWVLLAILVFLGNTWYLVPGKVTAHIQMMPFQQSHVFKHFYILISSNKIT